MWLQTGEHPCTGVWHRDFGTGGRRGTGRSPPQPCSQRQRELRNKQHEAFPIRNAYRRPSYPSAGAYGGAAPVWGGSVALLCFFKAKKKKKKNNNNNTHKDGLSFGFKSSSSVPGLGRGFFIAIALQTGSSAIRDKDSASQDNGPWSGAVPPAVRGRCPGQPPLLPQGGGGARMLIINILPFKRRRRKKKN